MTIDPHQPIDPIRGPETGATPQTGKVSDPAVFERLLDELRAVGRVGGEEASGLDALQQDLDKADRDFKQVMDLRGRLEDAYRRALGEDGPSDSQT